MLPGATLENMKKRGPFLSEVEIHRCQGMVRGLINPNTKIVLTLHPGARALGTRFLSECKSLFAEMKKTLGKSWIRIWLFSRFEEVPLREIAPGLLTGGKPGSWLFS